MELGFDFWNHGLRSEELGNCRSTGIFFLDKTNKKRYFSKSYVIVCVCIYPIYLPWARCYTRSIFKLCKAVLNSVFHFHGTYELNVCTCVQD